jgi:hypothetical protein
MLVLLVQVARALLTISYRLKRQWCEFAGITTYADRLIDWFADVVGEVAIMFVFPGAALFFFPRFTKSRSFFVLPSQFPPCTVTVAIFC